MPPTVELLEGDVLYREWVPGPAGRTWWVGMLAALAVAAAAALGVARGSLWVAIPSALVFVVALLMALTAFSFRGLSLVVDRRGIAWRFGFFARRYALAEVSMFRERAFHFPKATGIGGWGIGRANDGVDTYEVWGANGTAIDLIVRRGETTKHYLVSSAAPERLVVQLVRAFEREKKEAAAGSSA